MRSGFAPEVSLEEPFLLSHLHSLRLSNFCLDRRRMGHKFWRLIGLSTHHDISR